MSVKSGLLARVEPLAVIAERLSAGSLPHVFLLNVVAFGAGSIVVMAVLFDRVPRVGFHVLSPEIGGLLDEGLR